jgi:hypothetical protein
MRRILYLALLLGFAYQSTAVVHAQEIVTNDTILSLTQANMGEALTISKIKISSCSFDVSTNALLSLKKAGVPDGVIQTMIQVSTPDANVTTTKMASASPNDPKSPHDAGIYSYDSK